jgi:hypothetical protein
LSYNQLSGSIPSSIGSITGLGFLNLSNNLLTGTIPSVIGSLTNLGTLYLNGNQLNGVVPSSIGNLTNLTALDVSSNLLTSMPSSLGSLTNMYLFNCYHNRFTFNSLEPVVQGLGAVIAYSPQDTILPVHFANGKLNVSAGGTIANNTYQWLNPQGGLQSPMIMGDSTFTPNGAGNWFVIVSNSIASKVDFVSNTFAIGINGLPVLPVIQNAAVTPASSCGSGGDGGIYVYLTGGLAPFSFVLTKPGGATITQAKGQFTGLATGIYSVIVTDKNNNTASANGITITKAATITSKVSVYPTSGCSAVKNGSILAGANGGSAPFHYVLTKPGGSTVAQRTALFSNLAAGSYSLTAIDTTGCSSTFTGLLVQIAAPIAVTPVITAASNCGTGNDGTITAASTGGVSPFHYLLTKPDNSTEAQESPIFGNISIGTYSLTVTDTSGCTGTLTGVTLARAAAIALTAGTMPASSCGNINGGINFGRTGGLAPFRYQLTKPDNSTITQRSTSFTSLAGGIYSVMVTDTAGCTGALTAITIARAAAIAPKASVTAATSCGNGSDGSIIAGSNGGVGPFHYALTLPNNSTLSQESGNFTSLSPGTYSLVATDTDGCTGTKTGIIITKGVCPPGFALPAVTASDAVNQAAMFTVQALPNPTRTAFTLAITSPKNDAVEITVTDMYGRTVHHAIAPANSQHSFGSTFAAGMYIVRVMQGNEVKTLKLIKQ